MLSNEGEVLTFGEGSVGQLGRSSRTEHIRSSIILIIFFLMKFLTYLIFFVIKQIKIFIIEYMVDETGRTLKLNVLDHGRLLKFIDVFACGFWTIAKAEDGRLFCCGQNNFGQLGIKSSSETIRMANGSTPTEDNGDEIISKLILYCF